MSEQQKCRKDLGVHLASMTDRLRDVRVQNFFRLPNTRDMMGTPPQQTESTLRLD